MRLKRENFYYVGSLKNAFLGKGEGSKKKLIYRGELPKKGGLHSLQIQRRGLGKGQQCTLCTLLGLTTLSFPILCSLN